MIRSRATPDGLPFRLYERYGARVYSIGYKMKSGRWAFKADAIRLLGEDAGTTSDASGL